MSALPTISETVQIGDISIYKAGNNNAKGSLFGRRIATPTSPVLIAIVTDALRWANEAGVETDQSLRQVANYLIWLCGRYALEARNILSISSGGGSVVPSSGGDTELFPYDWIVTADSTPLAEGETSVVLDGTGGMQDFRGFNLEFYRGGQPQYTTLPPDGVSTYYSWNRTTGALILKNGAAQLGEQMRLVPIAAESEASSSPSGDTTVSDWWATTEGESAISGDGNGGGNFAGKRVILVVRGTPLQLIDSGVPSGPQALYELGEEISFDATNTFGPGETVTVVWVESE